MTAPTRRATEYEFVVPGEPVPGDRAQYTFANGSVDRDLIIRRSARDRFCDAWDKDGVGCDAEIKRGELHAANRYGLAHFCLRCVEVCE